MHYVTNYLLPQTPPNFEALHVGWYTKQFISGKVGDIQTRRINVVGAAQQLQCHCTSFPLQEIHKCNARIPM